MLTPSKTLNLTFLVERKMFSTSLENNPVQMHDIW